MKRRLGRPRRMTLEQVIDAACEIGLDRLDMASVAQKLGVGVATLYGYVQDREHLLQLVAGKLAGGDIIEDRGQSWEDALREHADIVYRTYRSWPQLIALQLNGSVGNLADSPHPNALLDLLLARGIEPADALAVYLEVNQAVAGVALTAASFERRSEDAGGEPTFARKVRAACEEHDYGALRRCLDASRLEDLVSDHRPAVERAIAGQKDRMKRDDGVKGARSRRAERSE